MKEIWNHTLAGAAATRPATPHRPISYLVAFPDGGTMLHGAGQPAFVLQCASARAYKRFLRGSRYRTALDFVRGRFDVEGDLVAAIHCKLDSSGFGPTDLWATLAASLAPSRWYTRFQSRRRAASAIRFHYDRPAEFYRLFLDARLVYSCAYFRSETDSIETAQAAKLDHICHKLELHGGDRFLDVGCGWGGLVFHAAERYGAYATGCTLSAEQAKFVSTEIERRHLKDRVDLLHCDYRAVGGALFDKIASVGMFEHVGRHRMRRYFRHVWNLLESDGLFLNHGIIRPEGARNGPETRFLQRYVFPGGELITLSAAIRAAEIAGFEVLDVENLRPHYALTCRRWIERLRANAEGCIRWVGEPAYRTWLLFLAGSAASFEAGGTDLCQLLLAKRHSHRLRRLTREHLYA